MNLKRSKMHMGGFGGEGKYKRHNYIIISKKTICFLKSKAILSPSTSSALPTILPTKAQVTL